MHDVCNTSVWHTASWASFRKEHVFREPASEIGAVQAEAKERKEGSLKEVALLTMELDELRSADFEGQYEEKKEQVRCGPSGAQ